MTASVPLDHGLILAAGLFVVGLVAVLSRRNVLFIFLGVEIMLSAAAVAFISGGARWQEAEGQIMFFLVLTMAAAELAVGLALVIQLYSRFRTLDIDAANRLGE